MKLKISFVGLLFAVVLATVTNAGYVGECSRRCPYGHVLNSATCQCVVASRCPQLKCVAGPLPCREYQKDASGCNTCKCLDRCYRSRCPRTCHAGTEIYVDERSCTACRCKQQHVCNYRVKCAVHCPHGFVKDALNCDTCQCKSCGYSCNIGCIYGRVRDYNGCELCECNPKPQCGPVCAGTCLQGRVLDRYGCPSCQCLG